MVSSAAPVAASIALMRSPARYIRTALALALAENTDGPEGLRRGTPAASHQRWIVRREAPVRAWIRA